MRIEATLDEWKELYDIAIKIKLLKPWEKLWSMDLITLIEKDRDEPYLCSVMGKDGECYAIASYNTINAIRGFFDFAYNKGIPANQLIRYQDNIMCYFGDREELTKEERKIIDDLGLKFRGKNNWIYFRRFEYGYAQYMPNKEEVIEFTKVLNHLYIAITEIYNGFKVDFENGKTLMHKFDDKSGKWVNSEEDVLIPDMDYYLTIFKDELLIKKLKKNTRNSSILELDIAYLNTAIKDKEFSKPITTRLCMLVDAENGVILSQNMVTPKNDDRDVIFETIINYICQNGLPKSIVVRDDYIGSIIYDLCDKLDIEVLESPKLYGIDEFIEAFYQFRY